MPQLGAECPPLRSCELIGSQAGSEASDVVSGYSINNHEKIPVPRELKRHSDLGASTAVMEWGLPS